MGTDARYQEALTDTLKVLIERAADLRGATDEHDRGVLLGYFETISTLLDQLETFGIDRHEVGLADFDPHSLLAPFQEAA